MPLQATRKTLSDEDMAAIEGGDSASPASTPSQGSASAPQPRPASKPSRKVLSDDEMSALEGGQGPQNPSDARAGKQSIGGKAFDFATKALMGPTGDVISAAGGSPSAIARAGIDTATLGNLGYNKNWQDQLAEDKADYPKSAMFGHVGGALGLAAVGNEIPALTALKSLYGGVNLTPTLMAGAQGLLSKPGEAASALDDIKQRIANGKTSAEIGALIHGGANAGSWAGDKLMGMATGLKDAVGGMGKRIADEGLFGTRGMMNSQADSGINSAENTLTDAVQGMKGKLSSMPSVQALLDKAREYKPSAGPVPSSNVPFKDAAEWRAMEAYNRPNMDPADYLDASRKIAKPAYDPNGSALDNFKSKLDQIDAGAMKTRLKEAAGAQGIPQVGDALGSQEALYTAKNGMNAPLNPADYVRMAAKAAGASAVGAGLGSYEGKPGAAAGGLAGLLMSTPAGQSVAAQGLIQGAKASPAFTKALLDNYLRTQREKQQ